MINLKTGSETMKEEFNALYEDYFKGIESSTKSEVCRGREYSRRDALYNESEYNLFQSITDHSFITMLIPKGFNPMDSNNEDILILRKSIWGFDFNKYSFIDNTIEHIGYTMKLDGGITSDEIEKHCYPHHLTKTFKSYSIDNKSWEELVSKYKDNIHDLFIGEFWSNYDFLAYLRTNTISNLKTTIYKDSEEITGKVQDIVIPTTSMKYNTRSIISSKDYDDLMGIRNFKLDDEDCLLYEYINKLDLDKILIK